MLKQLPFKKEYLLIAVAIVLLLVSYQLAFKKTIEAWQLNAGLKRQLTQSADISYPPGYLERKNANLAKIINRYKADTIDFRSNIIGVISAIAEKEGVKLAAVPAQDPFYHTTQFMIQKLDFEGDYFSMIKALNRLQSMKSIGVVRSANFKISAVRYNQGATPKLVLEVYLQIINN